MKGQLSLMGRGICSVIALSFLLCGWAMTPVAAEEADVYVIIGQSNADGRGAISDVPVLSEYYNTPNPNLKIYFKKMARSGSTVDPNSTYKVDDGAWWTLGKSYNAATETSNMVINGGTSFDGDANTIMGPELELGRVYAEANPDKELYIIKCAIGGSAIDAGGWLVNSPENSAGIWNFFKTYVYQPAITKLQATGKTPVIRGIYWMQGESDNSSTLAAAYDANLKVLIELCRGLEGCAEAPFIIGQLSKKRADNGVPVSEIQADVAGSTDSVRLIITDDYAINSDKTHYSGAGQAIIAQRIYDECQGVPLVQSLTVEEGTGSGIYTRGARVVATAKTKEGLNFAHWRVEPAGTILSDPFAQTLKVTLGNDAVILTPEYSEAGSCYYVNTAARGANDGTSWENAYTNLSTALTGRIAGEQIYVASGTYSSEAAGSAFTVPAGVLLYGGYSPDGLGNRNLEVYTTILTKGAQANTRIVKLNAGSSSSSMTVLDGFTITGGNKTGAGGGVVILGSNVEVNHCIIQNNTGTAHGGGLAVSTDDGSAISATSNIWIRNSIITGNTTSGQGAVILWGPNCVVENCLIYGNSTVATNTDGISFNALDQKIINCTIKGRPYRMGAGSGGGMFNSVLIGSGISMAAGTCSFQNCATTVANFVNIGEHSNNLFSQAETSLIDANYRPIGGSALIDYGLPAADIGVVGLSMMDLEGKARTGNPDVGAYEYLAFGTEIVPSAEGRLYLKPFGSGNGSSWDNALNGSLFANAVVAENVNEVWAAEGLYALTASLTPPANIKLYGGLDGISSEKIRTGYSTLTDSVLASMVVLSNAGVTFDGFDLDGQKALYDRGATNGSGIRTTASNITISNCIVRECKSAHRGAIGIEGNGAVNITVDNCLIYNNEQMSGGGIRIQATSGTAPSNVRINRCIIRDNKATLTGSLQRGGGIDVSAGTNLVISNCDILGNTATGTNEGHGGGIHLGVAATITNCILTGNNAGGNGGGICAYAQPIISNCLFANNTGGNGSAYATRGNFTVALRNCTIVRNGPTAIRGYDGSGNRRIDFVNTVMWGNAGNDYIALISASTATQCAFETGLNVGTLTQTNCTTLAAASSGNEASAGSGNLGGPYFTKASGVTGSAAADRYTADWHLLPVSPLINRGSKDNIADDAKDIDGEARIQWGYPDIGAYESEEKGRVNFTVTAPASKTYDGLPISAAVSSDPSSAVNITKTVWYTGLEPVVSGTMMPPVDAGLYTATASTTDSQNWIVGGENSQAFDINKATQTLAVTAGKLTVRLNEFVTFDVDASSAGGTVGYTVFPASGWTADESNPNQITFKAEGTYRVVYSRTENPNYLPIPEVILTVIVTDKTIPVVSVFPTIGEVDVNDMLNAAELSGGTVKAGAEGDAATLEGTWRWALLPDPVQTPVTVEYHDYVAVFTPNNITDYSSVSQLVSVPFKTYALTCGENCTADSTTYRYLDQVTVTPGDIEGKNFKNWTVKNSATQELIQILTDSTLSPAVFSMPKYSVTITPEWADSSNRIYFTPNGSGNQNGTCWEQAYSTAKLQEIVKSASDGSHLWLAAGEYSADANDGDTNSLFVVSNKIHIYGGFSGTETDTVQRSKVENGNPWEFQYPTILKRANTALKSRILLINGGTAADSSLIEGITVQDGLSANGTGCGGIRVSQNCSATIRNCIVKNNTGTTDVGGIDLWGNSMVENSLITGNTATTDGGGVKLRAENSIVRDCTISDNIAKGNGAGLSIESVAEINDCIISGNAATLGGGGFFVNAATKIIDCTVNNNTAATSGGGTYFSASGTGSEISGCAIGNNTATVNGGGIYANSIITITDNKIYDNRANGTASHDGGGGICGIVGLNVTRCSFIGNKGKNGGAVRTKANSVFTSCLFANNNASQGGALAIRETTHTLTAYNCTFVKNSGSDGSVARLFPGSGSNGTLNMYNSIVYDNDGTVFSSGTFKGYYSALQTITNVGTKDTCLVFGAGVSANFVRPSSAAGETATDRLTADWNLTPQSSCLNYGVTAVSGTDLPLGDLDLAGNSRIWNGYKPDLGAYELQEKGVLNYTFAPVVSSFNAAEQVPAFTAVSQNIPADFVPSWTFAGEIYSESVMNADTYVVALNSNNWIPSFASNSTDSVFVITPAILSAVTFSPASGKVYIIDDTPPIAVVDMVVTGSTTEPAAANPPNWAYQYAKVESADWGNAVTPAPEVTEDNIGTWKMRALPPEPRANYAISLTPAGIPANESLFTIAGEAIPVLSMTSSASEINEGSSLTLTFALKDAEGQPVMLEEPVSVIVTYETNDFAGLSPQTVTFSAGESSTELVLTSKMAGITRNTNIGVLLSPESVGTVDNSIAATTSITLNSTYVETGIRYLSVIGSGHMNGKTWDAAAPGSVDSINALIREAAVDSLFFAGGTYILGKNYDASSTTAAVSINRTVAIYGGFNHENSPVERIKIEDGKAWEFVNPTVFHANSDVGRVVLIAAGTWETPVVMDGVTIENGSGAGGGGRGLRVDSGSGLIENCVIQNNTSTEYEGGVLLRSRSKIVNSLIHGNSGVNGGGIGITSSEECVISGCTISDNRATNEGAGIHATTSFELTRCTLIGNKAALGGGLRTGANTVATSCLFANNNASTGGGALVTRGTAHTIITYNCTFVKNSGSDGSVARLFPGSGSNGTLNMYNSIVYDNDGTVFSSGTFKGYYSALQTITNVGTKDTCLVFGAGVSANFVRPSSGAGETATDRLTADWNLTPQSSCLNYGVTAISGTDLPLGDLDLAGNSRIWNGYKPDLGAYELQEKAVLSYTFTPASIVFNSTAQAPVFSATSSVNVPDGYVPSWTYSGTVYQEPLNADTYIVALDDANWLASFSQGADSVFVITPAVVTAVTFTPASGKVYMVDDTSPIPVVDMVVTGSMTEPAAANPPNWAYQYAKVESADWENAVMSAPEVTEGNIGNWKMRALPMIAANYTFTNSCNEAAYTISAVSLLYVSDKADEDGDGSSGNPMSLLRAIDKINAGIYAYDYSLYLLEGTHTGGDLIKPVKIIGVKDLEDLTPADPHKVVVTTLTGVAGSSFINLHLTEGLNLTGSAQNNAIMTACLVSAPNPKIGSYVKLAHCNFITSTLTAETDNNTAESCVFWNPQSSDFVISGSELKMEYCSGNIPAFGTNPGDIDENFNLRLDNMNDAFFGPGFAPANGATPSLSGGPQNAYYYLGRASILINRGKPTL